jgi:hypothetical protein
MVTETDELAEALDLAAERWPGLSRGQLVMRLALEGHRAGLEDRRQRRERRLAARRASKGALTGSYGPGYLERLRDEWPP